MDRGYGKGLRLEPDRKRRSTWLGLLIGAWLLIALLAWFDPFALGHRAYQSPLRDPGISLHSPEQGGFMPRDVTLETDGFGAVFAFGTIVDAPRFYGTQEQLNARGAGRYGGPWSLTEAWSREARGEALLSNVGDAVRVVAIVDPGMMAERVVTVDAAETDLRFAGPQEAKLVLSRGCLRLGSVEGPLVILSQRAAGLFLDPEDWLTVGNYGPNQLRVGEVGEILIEQPVADEAPLRALRLQCGGNGEVVQVGALHRMPVCDLTAQQAATNRAALTLRQRAISDRMVASRQKRISACMTDGSSRIACERRTPPMPPAPLPPGEFTGDPPFSGLAPGDMCLPQEDVPAGAWTRDQPS